MQEKIINMPIIAISGADGVGKGYITRKICDLIGAKEIPMITTRPLRQNDSKVFVSEKEFLQQQQQNKLLGDHKNDNGHNYAYRIEDIYENLNQVCIIELNPVFQKPEYLFAKNQLGSKNIKRIGLLGDPDYLEYNMKNRDINIKAEELVKKLAMGEKINKALKILSEKDIITLFKVNFNNRGSIVEEVLGDLLKTLKF